MPSCSIRHTGCSRPADGYWLITISSLYESNIVSQCFLIALKMFFWRRKEIEKKELKQMLLLFCIQSLEKSSSCVAFWAPQVTISFFWFKIIPKYVLSAPTYVPKVPNQFTAYPKRFASLRRIIFWFIPKIYPKYGDFSYKTCCI